MEKEMNMLKKSMSKSRTYQIKIENINKNSKVNSIYVSINQR